LAVSASKKEKTKNQEEAVQPEDAPKEVLVQEKAIAAIKNPLYIC
jgi:hypothetical protein